jgi:hypothetical protein
MGQIDIQINSMGKGGLNKKEYDLCVDSGKILSYSGEKGI